MNLRQPYEQLIADKLRKIPAPDADESWQQMKGLLEEDEDTRGGGGKRFPGNGKGWWGTGIIALLLLTSLGIYVAKTSLPGASLAKSNNSVPAAGKQFQDATENRSSLNTKTQNKTTLIDKNITLSGSNKTNTANNNYNTREPAPPLDNIKYTPLSTNKATGATTTNDTANHLNKTFAGSRYNNLTPQPATPGFAVLAGSATGKKNKPVIPGSNNPLVNSEGNEIPMTRINDRMKKQGAGNRSTSGEDIMAGTGAGIQYPLVNRLSRAPNKTANGFESQYNFLVGTPPPAFRAALPGDSIETTRNTGNLLNNETKKLVVKTQRDLALEDMTRKEKKILHLDLSNVFKPFSLHMDAEPRWAAGVAVNSRIPLGAQGRYNYNMNAKSGTFSDYIPSLYLQFHLNDYVYMQMELNFVSPQYTPQMLVYRQNNGMGAQPGMSLQKSIYLQKLYYFSLPVSLHYSPVNNFYFSVGLQFSSFQSGLVAIQENQYTTLSGPDHPSNVSNTVLKFKDDSIAATIRPNEWRWQAGADYYWNRFTVGMRYNRSFKTLFQGSLPGSLAPTNMRNESLVFFIRYNLFESRKKGSQGQKD
ncbi:MAG: hypothetical protein ABI813_02920 [Bacteroidota bacterium]